MDYLKQNRHEYLQSPQNIINFTGQYIQTYTDSTPFIICTPTQSITSNIQTIKFPNLPTLTNTTTFNLVQQSISSNHNILLCNAGLAFSCSNFTSITTPSYDGVTSSDTITFTISTGDSSVTKTYGIEKQFINTYQLYDYLKVNSSDQFTLTATSTIPLSYYPVQRLPYDSSGTYTPANEVVCKIVLL